MANNSNPPIISIVGWANTGKTTFLEKLVAELQGRGVRVGVIKHHRGPFEMDKPGKDSWRMARAGAACTAIAGPGKVGLVMEMEGDPDPGDIAALMCGVDLVFTEGYKEGPYPQLEVRRAGYGEDQTAARAVQLVAVVGDCSPSAEKVPCFAVGDIPAVANFILARFLAGRS